MTTGFFSRGNRLLLVILELNIIVEVVLCDTLFLGITDGQGIQLDLNGNQWVLRKRRLDDERCFVV
jgi:hypothetical protein